jgi:uncharacterized protein (TIGR03437 family)
MKYLLIATIACSLHAAPPVNQRTQTRHQDLRERAQPYLDSARAAGNAFVSVSAASLMPNLAADSLATALGDNLAPRTESATAPYPTNLGGISLSVVDSAGVSRIAQLLYVSPTQINYLVPAGTATGTATMNIVDGTGNVPSSTAQIQAVAPGLFTVNENGRGVVAATAYRLVDLKIQAPVQIFQCLDRPVGCGAVPIDLGLDAPVFVTFFATGLRGRSSDSAVTVTIGGQSVPINSISSLDDSSPSAGLDEVLLVLPLSLRGSGEVNIVISVEGTISNNGTISIK